MTIRHDTMDEPVPQKLLDGIDHHLVVMLGEIDECTAVSLDLRDLKLALERARIQALRMCMVNLRGPLA